MGLAGNNIGIANFQLRFFVLVFFGIAALGSVLYWRQQTLIASTYVDIPTRSKTAASAKSDFKSKNYQIEVEESSPSVK